MKTQTPIYTGDAFGKSNVLKPQPILGSLRFWLEVFCYAAGELNINCKNEKVDRDELFKKVNNIIEEQEVSLFEAKKNALKELGVSIPSQVFGCNGWEGFVKINEINFCKKQIRLPKAIYKNKNKSDGWNEIYPGDNRTIDKKKEHVWYFPVSSLFGEAKIKLELADEKIGDDIIFPLLSFIQKYGFFGGRNNLGFGRVKFNLENFNLSEFNQFRFYNRIITIDDVIEEKEKFDDLINDDLVKKRKIGFYELDPDKSQNEDSIEKKYLNMIETLLSEKSMLRYRCKQKYIKNKEKRHFVFGFTGKNEEGKIEETNATKIIPWINHIAENNYKYGFISLILLETFPRG